MKYIIIFFILLCIGCSANWHLQRAITKNPKLLDSTIKYLPYYKDTTVYINIYIKGDSSSQKTKQLTDSLQQVFNDSFTTVYQIIDSLHNLKTTVVRKPFIIHDSINVIIHDTLTITSPTQFVVKKEVSNVIWILILIALILFLLLLHRYKK